MRIERVGRLPVKMIDLPAKKCFRVVDGLGTLYMRVEYPDFKGDDEDCPIAINLENGKVHFTKSVGDRDVVPLNAVLRVEVGPE